MSRFILQGLANPSIKGFTACFSILRKFSQGSIEMRLKARFLAEFILHLRITAQPSAR